MQFPNDTIFGEYGTELGRRSRLLVRLSGGEMTLELINDKIGILFLDCSYLRKFL